jgi:hypothetical protein
MEVEKQKYREKTTASSIATLHADLGRVALWHK